LRVDKLSASEWFYKSLKRLQMTDIFDEIDDILNDVDSSEASQAAEDSMSNFNESELQDIMAEIDNLESDSVEEQILAPSAHVDLQKEMDEEFEMSMNLKESNESSVLPFEAAKNKDSNLETNSEVSFAATGQMNLNLEFKIGNDSAKLSIDPVKGLIVTMSGARLSINQDSGCTVIMDSGVNFTIPLTGTTSISKKKSA
jgi:hypothetical protein